MIIADSWSAKSAEIIAARPDLVVASVPYQMEALAEILKAGIPVLALAPHSLADVYGDIAKIAGLMGVPERGAEVIRGMQAEVAQAQASASPLRPRVYCEEWGKPLIHSQGWVKELVEAAGGEFVGTPGATTAAAVVRILDPEVIIAAWCGAGDRVPLERLIESRGWQQTSAARSGRVFCINDEFLNTPGPTLIRGLHAIAGALRGQRSETVPGLRALAGATARPL